MFEASIQHVRPYIDHASLGAIVQILVEHIPLFKEMIIGTATVLDKLSKLKTVFGIHSNSKRVQTKLGEAMLLTAATPTAPPLQVGAISITGADDDDDDDEDDEDSEQYSGTF